MKLLKYNFFIIEVIYLEFIVGAEGVKIDSIKIKIIVDWRPLRIVTNIKSFTRFARFYYR